MSILSVDGANLSYNVVGNGPALIFVPGANGTGDIFAKAAEFLKNDFTVITYDRRNYGASELTKPIPEEAKNSDSTYRIKTDAADIAALVEHVAKEPAYILGSSSGSIVVMETLQAYPEIFKKAFFHESPINVFLNDKESAQANNNEIVELANHGKLSEAMMRFAKFMKIGELDRQMMTNPPTNLSEEQAKEALRQRMFWMNYEIRQYTSRQIDLATFKNNQDKVVLLNGTDSGSSFPCGVMNQLSAAIDVPITMIPGGHLGYAQKPEGFAEVIKEQR
ncbi:alpha/beta hydrolase [Enterococcus pseudoavium]|nr:alpha/beta hydrolase [Enterococcus pseudoavium]